MSQRQQPGESDREYLARLARQSAEQIQREKRAMRGDPRADAERQQHVRDRKMDRAFEDDLKDILGGSLNELRKEFNADTEAGKAVRWADSAWTKSGKAKRAKKIQPKIKKARKENSSGCWLTGVVLMAVATSAGWGLYEGASAVLGWS